MRMGTFYISTRFCGRPMGRRLASRPKRAAVRVIEPIRSRYRCQQLSWDLSMPPSISREAAKKCRMSPFLPPLNWLESWEVRGDKLMMHGKPLFKKGSR